MPTGQTPTPQFKRGSALPYGVATRANEAEFMPQGEEEQFLFGLTDRPSEPLTAGAPFGPGPDISKHAVETEDQLADRVAELLIAKGGSKESVAWARRRLAGE